MLIAHLVPGYWGVIYTQKDARPRLTKYQQVLLWGASFAGTVYPDLDVIINLLFRHSFQHQILWTHGIWGAVIMAAAGRLFLNHNRCTFVRSAVYLFAFGWLSHIFLDLIVHGTPLFYPFSMIGFELAPKQIVEGGAAAYLAHPLFLLEPLLISTVVIHLALTRRFCRNLIGLK